MATEEIPARVQADPAYRNARRNSDPQNARMEHDKAPGRAMTAVLGGDTQLLRQYQDDTEFRRGMSDKVSRLTYAQAGAVGEVGSVARQGPGSS